MLTEIVTPAPRGSRAGNRVTALRWARVLRRLGHRVVLSTEHRRADADLVIAVHARRSHASIRAAHDERSTRPLCVLLSGTDLYVDLERDSATLESLELATRVIALHPGVPAELPPALATKTRVILQSASPPSDPPPRRDDRFEVVVVGHLREIKDPFRAAAAAALLPPSSRVAVIHIGEPLSPDMATEARRTEREQPRYRWLGLLTRAATLRWIAQSRLLVLTSRAEGGANVISEAAVCGVPILSTRISAAVALLGEDYPGLFPVGDTARLTELLQQAERDPTFLGGLTRRCRAAAAGFDPARELETWRSLLAELAG